jgi:PAS domain S-box-containing protein
MADAERITFSSGSFSHTELETMLNTLPVDITFVDREDKVAYFSQSRDRIFARSKAAIGKKVQECHPQKSFSAVNRILNDFRSKKSDAAEFWLELNDRLIYIRYFAARGPDNEYLGCLEVTQDITDLKKITGEKRL